MDYFFTQIKIPKRKRNAETFFQRELLLYVSLLIINLYEQFLKLNFQGNNPKLKFKNHLRIKTLTLKRFRVK